MTTVSAVSSVAERLNNLLLVEGAPVKCVGDLHDGVLRLRSDLDLIEQFLSDQDATSSNSAVISQDLNQQITQLAYDIEDSVESYVRRQETAATSKGRTGGSIRTLFSPHSSPSRSLREDLHTLKRRIDEQIKLLTGGGGEGSSRGGKKGTISIVEPPQRRRGQQVPSNRVPMVVVGMEDDADMLKSLLTKGNSELSVIGICGMGGLGKTTLAKLLYDDPLVVNHFDNRAWATMSSEFQARDTLETLLFCLVSNRRSKDEIAEMETMELMQQLYEAQKGRRYLVVLDDVWSIEAWDNLKFAFPDDGNGSRILITTRRMDLASSISTTASILAMKLLTLEQSWQLFEMRSGLQDQGLQVNPGMMDIGMHIVSYCKGLPLAINIVAGILRGKNLEDWELMLQRLQKGLSFELEPTLALSYNQLPSHLKPCFLYLGHFPEDEAIPVEKLYLLWMAEGLISMRTLNNKSRIEAAEDYFSELVDRNLVNVVKEEDEEVSDSRRFRSCRVHDLIRDLCIWKGKEEGFFKSIGSGHGNEINSFTRRLAIFLNKLGYTDDVLLNIPDAKHIRSIMFYDTCESLPKPTWPEGVADLKEFQGARILDFGGVDFRVKRLPRGIEKLSYLRHLSFQGCYLHEFPSSFINFTFLETLDLRVRVSCVMTIPNVLWKFSSLRHLYFPLSFRSDTKHKLKLDSLRNLVILENFHAGVCDADDLLQLENLQILTGTVDGDNKDLQNMISVTKKIKFVVHSSLVVKNFDSRSKERLSIVAALLECNALKALDMEGYLGVFPRNEGKIGPNLSSIVFNGSEFSEDPMPILGKLPNLRSLVLCNDAFVGTKMVCSESDFLQLRSLKLATLQSLEKLEVVEGVIVMPTLTILTIEECCKLEMLPYEFAKIPTLQKLMIGSMSKEFQDKVRKIIQEQRDCGNEVLSVTFYD